MESWTLLFFGLLATLGLAFLVALKGASFRDAKDYREYIPPPPY